MEINNTPIVPFGVWSVCNWNTNVDTINTCETWVSWYPNVTFTHKPVRGDTSVLYRWDAFSPYFAAEEMYYSVHQSKYNIGARKDEPYFFGYMINPEEPINQTEVEDGIADYATNKAFDSEHPIGWATLWYQRDTRNVSEGSDYIIWDEYHNRVNCGTYESYKYSSCTTLGFTKGKYMLGLQRDFYLHMLDSGGFTGLEQIPKPVFYTSLQQNQSYVLDGDYFFQLTPQQLRTEAIWAFTAGFVGYDIWHNILWTTNWEGYGMGSNQSTAIVADKLAGDIMSAEMQEVLTLPTLNYSVLHSSYRTWDEKVNFSVNPTETVYTSFTGVSLSYRLKHNTTSDKYYLIVANVNNITVNSTVTIQGLSGTMNATTIGITGTGSDAPGQVHTVIDGGFEESFSPFSGNVYEISTDAAEEPPASTSFSICGSGCDSSWSNFWYEGKP